MKQYLFHGLALAFVCLNWCCQSKSKESQPVQKLVLHQPPQLDSIDNTMMKKHIVTCNCGDSSQLVVETQYYAVPDSVTHHKILIINQEMWFAYAGEKKHLSLPFFEKKYVYGSQLLTIRETALYEIKCISNGQKYIFSLYGIHWFDPPHEFFGLCSIKGEWLWYYYGSMHEVFKEYGNEEKYQQEFENEINSLKNMIPVLPELY